MGLDTVLICHSLVCIQIIAILSVGVEDKACMLPENELLEDKLIVELLGSRFAASLVICW